MKNADKLEIWIRAETRWGERRVLLIPVHAGALVRAGFKVYVEKSDTRIYSNKDYEIEGCHLVEPGSWSIAPKDACVIGFKELPQKDFALTQRHFYGGHCFDGEKGSPQLLKRYHMGNGTLYALEMLLDSQKKQLVPKGAGYLAGVCGAAIALLVWRRKKDKLSPPFGIPKHFENQAGLKQYLSSFSYEHLMQKAESLIIAPNGMAGRGVRSLLDSLKIKYDVWTRKETANKHIIENILDYELVFNCISIDCIAENEDVPVFLTEEALDSASSSKLSVIGDISCYALHPRNSFPVYSRLTTFDHPTLQVKGIDIVAIDNLPTMLPRECSDMVSEDFFPLLCQFLLVGDDIAKTAWPYAVERFNIAIKRLAQ